MIGLLAITACKKDQTDPPADSPTLEPISVTLRTNWMFMNGSAMFALNSSVLHDSLGVAVQLDTVRFYVSGLQALNMDDGLIHGFNDAYLLLDPAQADNNFLIGSFSTTQHHLHSLVFDIGLDDAANGGDPATAAPPLDDPTMHFTGSSYDMGYKFLVVTGHADVGGTGSYDTPVSFVCGMSDARTPVRLELHHDLTDGEVYAPMVHADLGGLFNGIDLSATPTGDMHSDEAMRVIRNLAEGVMGM